jgi:hypothetical protein
MPTRSDRNQAADALSQAFLVQLIANIEAQQWEDDESESDSDSDSESESGSSDWSSSSSSDDSDEEMTPEEQYIHDLGELYSRRYLVDREEIPKSGEFLRLLLHVYKHSRPAFFRSYLRIDPDCFDALVATISDDPVFHNDSNNAQMPVEEQLAIALYRFGHYGNAASTLKVALQFGVGYGTVRLCTSRVMKACCSARFRDAAVQWSGPEAKEAAKQWVEDASCPAWRNGWLMVDGTLVPLFQRPAFFGNTWFDRKSNYSLNVQVRSFFPYSHPINLQLQLISTPDLQIIDYGVGLPGSQHDATAWEATRVPQQHTVLLEPDEWVWADSAYPLQKWCQAPYKVYNCFRGV